LRQPNWLGALLPFDSGENAINPNAGILKISKQISDRYPFTINADQTEIHFTLSQNRDDDRNQAKLQMKLNRKQAIPKLDESPRPKSDSHQKLGKPNDLAIAIKQPKQIHPLQEFMVGLR
jgi:hypothetical protein